MSTKTAKSQGLAASDFAHMADPSWGGYRSVPLALLFGIWSVGVSSTWCIARLMQRKENTVG